MDHENFYQTIPCEIKDGRVIVPPFTINPEIYVDALDAEFVLDDILDAEVVE